MTQEQILSASMLFHELWVVIVAFGSSDPSGFVLFGLLFFVWVICKSACLPEDGVSVECFQGV